MPVPLSGMLEQLFEAIDWTKLAVPAGAAAIFTVAYVVARKLAQRGVALQLKELESNLKVETEEHAAARATIEHLKIQQASHSAIMHAQQDAIEGNRLRTAKEQAEYRQVIAAWKGFHRELVALRESEKRHVLLRKEHAATQALVKVLEDESIGKDEKLIALRNDLDLREKQLRQAERRMKRARRLSGYLVKAKALLARPKFRPLSDRNRPIIAVAALKGGVGKTTLTAHLAGAMARKGYRVLLVDLDLQGSLTGLMLPHGTISDCVDRKRLLQDFFVRAMDNKAENLTDYIIRSPRCDGLSGSIDIVPTSDRLAYAELNLTLGWLLKQGERDARFLLRRALHLKGANAAYDIVLLDCPPVMNISCANALAAADYLLIPTLLTAKSFERVPKLVAAVQEEEFRRHLNGQLKVMGVVANRSRHAELKGPEAIIWKNVLPNSLDAIQSKHTKLFGCIIGQDVEISSNEEQYTHPKPGGRAHAMFAELLLELEGELPDGCRRA